MTTKRLWICFFLQSHQRELSDSVKLFSRNSLEQNHESNIFWENIDGFCIKVSIVLITNCVLNRNSKLQEHFGQTAIFDTFPNLLFLPFAFVFTQLGVQSLENKIFILYDCKDDKLFITIMICHFDCSILHVNAKRWLWKKGIDSWNLMFSAKVGFTSKLGYREKNLPQTHEILIQ